MTHAMPRMLRLALALTAAGLLGAFTAAHADQTTTANTATASTGTTTTDYVTAQGPYVGIGWGHFNEKLDNLNDVGQAVQSITHSGNDAWKVQLGYRLMPYFAVEGDYINFGHQNEGFEGTGSNGNYQLHMSGFAPFAVGIVPLGPAELFGKAGWLFYNSDLKVNLNSPGSQVIESTHSRSNFIWGGGLGFTILKHLNLSAEYDVIRLQNASNSNVFWLNAAWRF